ncbi:MAG: flippase [Clostridium butyricum]|nr:flippase [Clostridium butyricum]
MAKSISKNAIFKAALNLFNLILPILVMKVVTVAIGDINYGYFSYGESLNNYFLIFAAFGLYQYGLRELSKIREDKSKLSQTFTSLFVFGLITNFLVTAIYMGFIWMKYRNEPYYLTCFILSFNIAVNAFYVEWVNEALENYQFITIKTMIIRIIYSALIILGVKNTEDFTFYLLIVVGFNFINNIISFIYVKKIVKFDFSNLEFKKHIKPMFYLVILSNTGILYTQLDKLMLKNSSGGTTYVGYYNLAQKIMTMVNTVMLTVIQVTMPRLSNYLGNNRKIDYLNLLKKVIKIYFILLFPAALGLLCVSKEAIYIFSGPEYMPAAPVMIIFSIYMISLGIEQIIANQIIYLHGKEKTDAYLVLTGGVLNLILNIVLSIMGRFTMETAIITTLVSNTVVIFLEYRLVKKVIKLDIHLFAFENMKYLYYSLLFIPISWIVNRFVTDMIFSCFIQVIVCGALYLAILVITKDEMFFELFDKILRKLKLKKVN